MTKTNVVEKSPPVQSWDTCPAALAGAECCCRPNQRDLWCRVLVNTATSHYRIGNEMFIGGLLMHIKVCYNPDWVCTVGSVSPHTAPLKPQFCFVLQASLGLFEMGCWKYPLLLLIIIIGPYMPLPSRFISTRRHLPKYQYAAPTKLTISTPAAGQV